MLSEQTIHRLLSIIPHNQDYHSPISGLYIRHSDQPFTYDGVIQEPSICIILQGKREIQLGEQCFLFDNEHFMFCPVNVPMCGKIYPDTTNKPFFMLSLKIDLITVGKILRENPTLFDHNDDAELPTFLPWKLDNELLGAFERLLLLHESPQNISFLAPLIQQEIYYRLLISKLGYKLKQMVNVNSHTQKINCATDYLRQHFNERIRIETLAQQCGMSVSGFHSHFKNITGLSPLQYQKSLRLNTARRMIKQGSTVIAEIAYEVGYESPSQFSREYKRRFGETPRYEREMVL
ncbi:AraC family transcriptional regulator [Rodentibacter genomosp. 2]|uniref:AraC family transcriptional regulator n=1 Tax=Rodentibacter genomosp. 2 TaxID=1908266 RepID=A0A1V3JIT8_9PAST|nr:AraC family transcriptional regulator [Rodentibacter genomosp. 2]OOF56666.1 AraC family transcriptional regulator [Rodentibacter genomosp. 2]